MAHENDWVSIKEATPTTKRYLKLSHTITLTFTGGSYSPSVSYDLPQSAFRQRPSYGYYYGTGSLAGSVIVPSQLKVYQCQYDFDNTLLFSAMNSSKRNYFVNGISGIENVNIDPTSGSLHYESELGDDTSYASQTGSYYVMQCEIDMQNQTAPSEDGSTAITFSYIFEFEENETAAYDAVVAAFPNNTSEYFIGVGCIPFRQSFPDMIESINPGNMWLIDDDSPYRFKYPELIESINPYITWVIDDDIPYRIMYPTQYKSINPDNNWVIDDDIPYRLDYPPLIETINPKDVWLIDNDVPFRHNYPPLIESVGTPKSWLQTNGYEPYRPWPNHKTIFQTVEPVEVPSVDWSKGMQQTFEYYTVDPNTWYDVTCLTNIISCSLTHDSSSEMRGHASITTSEPLDENYIRIYMRVRQNGINQRFCLGTYLFIVSSDSFNGKRHSYTYTGYTPLIELKEKLAPLGYNVIGITGEKPELLPPRTAPTVTDEISRVIGQYSRLKLENNVLIERPLLNNFVSGTSDTWLAVVNNLLTASTLQQYELSVDNWGAVRIKEAITVYNEKHVYEYDDGNSSILLPTLDLTDDMTDIPNVVEVIYTGNGNKDIGYVRKVVKNEDTRSIVSIPSRGREIWRRFVISNIAMPLGEVTRDAIEDQVEAQANRLLEAASTIRKTIQYSHGFNGVEVGDTVLFNYERAGFTGIKAKVVSQTINCKPGCQVDETAVYTKRLWNRN